MFWVYSWDSRAGKWCFAGLEDDEEVAKEKARSLWRAGVLGVKIEQEVRRVVLEHRRH